MGAFEEVSYPLGQQAATVVVTEQFAIFIISGLISLVQIRSSHSVSTIDAIDA